MKITLLVEGARHAVELLEAGVTLGRGEAATLRLDSHAVSRVHAKFFLKNGRVYVMDMQSTNGTTLNGLALREATEVKPGETVLLGEIPVQYLPEVAVHEPKTPEPIQVNSSAHITHAQVEMEDRAFDTSGSILVPHASLETMLAMRAEKFALNPETLFKNLATMAGKLLRAANLQELLAAVMSLVTEHIHCQRGLILLLSPSGELVPERIWEEKEGSNPNPISRTIANTAMQDRVTILTTDARIDPRFAGGESIKIHGITSALCAPLIVDDQALGVIYLESSLLKGGFRPENQHLLSAMANFAAVGIQRDREARFRQRLERYHSPQVVGEILKAAQNSDAPLFQAQRCEITVLFADISGFTHMSEGLEPMRVANILNCCFEMLTEQIFAHGGTLDKYIGDAIMAFFGAPAPDPDHARHAVDAAIAMQKALQRYNESKPADYPELHMRIGINTGEAFAGDIGCEKRMDYTVMGSTVNLASRLESSVCKPDQIVVGPRTAQLLLDNTFVKLPSAMVKGIDHEILPFGVSWS